MAEIGKDIDKAKTILEKGGLVAIPTETVYGLAANALDPSVLLKIFKAKNRPSFDPLISHIGKQENLEDLVATLDEKVRQLATAFWPGPLTLLLPKKPHVPDILTSGLPRMAVRIPDHRLTLDLLGRIDFPLAAPSANPFGYVSPTRPEHVEQQLGDKVDYILDGGSCRIGIESTVVGIEGDEIIIHRLGGLQSEQLAKFGPVRFDLNQSSNPNAPGQLSAHYSPGKKLLIGNIPDLLKEYAGMSIATISFTQAYVGIYASHVLSESGSLDEAASHLFETLRTCAEQEIDLIVTERFPEEGIGQAINDRLLRAATTYQG